MLAMEYTTSEEMQDVEMQRSFDPKMSSHPTLGNQPHQSSAQGVDAKIFFPSVKTELKEVVKLEPHDTTQHESLVHFNPGSLQHWQTSPSTKAMYDSMCSFFDDQSIPSGYQGVCPFPRCNRACRNKGDLKDHINLIHMKYPVHICSLCLKPFLTTKKYHLHLREHGDHAHSVSTMPSHLPSFASSSSSPPSVAASSLSHHSKDSSLSPLVEVTKNTLDYLLFAVNK
jgi:hypothetical protein